MSEFEGRVAIVSGASSGMREATARRLAREGVLLVLLAAPRDGEALARVQAELGDRAVTVAGTSPILRPHITVTGGLVIEDAVHRVSTRTGARNLEDYARLLDRFGVDHTLLEAGEVASRWPQFRFDGGEQAIYQRDTGIVDAARANAVHAALARAHGAHIVENTPVLTVTQEQVTYYATTHLKESRLACTPSHQIRTSCSTPSLPTRGSWSPWAPDTPTSSPR